MLIKDIAVIHNAEKRRFEVRIDSHTAELTYFLNGDVITFTHTGVPPALEGRGIGSLLVKTGLQYARDHRLRVRTLCWFVSGYMDRHAEFRELAG